MPIASLPMYDLPGLAGANDHWWQRLREAMRRRGQIDLPEHRSHPQQLIDHWLSPSLVFSQTCGWPLVRELGDAVSLIATPCYRFAGCDGPRYSSALVVRRGDSRQLADYAGRPVAVNGRDSQSGHNALMHSLGQAGVGPDDIDVVVSGSHANSLAALQRGDADLAAIDCVSLGLLQENAAPSVAGLDVIGYSRPISGLPYITGTRHAGAIDDWRKALADLLTDQTIAPLKHQLGIVGMEVIPLDAYREGVESMASVWESSPEKR